MSNEANYEDNVLNNEDNVLNNLQNSDTILIGHININSLKNKFELLTEMVWDKPFFLMISETKLDSSFPDAQFYMKSCSNPYRLDRNSKGGGKIVYIREDNSFKLTNYSCIYHDKEYF